MYWLSSDNLMHLFKCVYKYQTCVKSWHSTNPTNDPWNKVEFQTFWHTKWNDHVVGLKARPHLSLIMWLSGKKIIQALIQSFSGIFTFSKHVALDKGVYGPFSGSLAQIPPCQWFGLVTSLAKQDATTSISLFQRWQYSSELKEFT